MKTTINRIMKYKPCYSAEQMRVLIDEIGIDTEITPMQILHRVGIEDTVWCLRAFDYRDYCLFSVDVAESALHIFEERYPDDKRPRQHLENVRAWHRGDITDDELATSRADAAAAAAYAYAAAAAAAAYAYAYAAAAAAAAAYAAAYAAAAAGAYAGADAAAYADAVAKWKEIEALFIKHFQGE